MSSLFFHAYHRHIDDAHDLCTDHHMHNDTREYLMSIYEPSIQ